MIFLRKNNKIIFIVLFIFLATATFCNVANANALTNGVSSIFSFVNKNIIGQIKKDFCNNYSSSISTGEWKSGEFRTNIGKSVCTSSNFSGASVEKIVQDIIQPLKVNLTVSKTNTPSSSLVNNPKPDIYVPNLIAGTDLDATQIIYLTNIERKNNDLTLVNLKQNSILAKIASIRVKDMFAKGYFEHNSPTGDNASNEAGKNDYEYITIGENIALGGFDGSSGVVTAWMNSPGHRANILNKNYTEIGVYAEKGEYEGQSVWIAAQIFGKPLSGCKEAGSNLKSKITKDEISADNMLAKIKIMDGELKALGTTDVKAYNSKVLERNDLSKQYNGLISEIKISVAEYNKQVAIFNSCIKTL